MSDLVYGITLIVIAILLVPLNSRATRARDRIRFELIRAGDGPRWQRIERELKVIRWSSGVLFLGFIALYLMYGLHAPVTESRLAILCMAMAIATTGLGWQAWTYRQASQGLEQPELPRQVRRFFLFSSVNHILVLVVLSLSMIRSTN